MKLKKAFCLEKKTLNKQITRKPLQHLFPVMRLSTELEKKIAELTDTKNLPLN